MNPAYRHVKFISSAPDLRRSPPDQGLEVAFAGRSNAGKSSAINALTQQKSLARISKTPGRTQLLNFFAVAEQKRFVDLPGYGYAKVPAEIKKKWQSMMEHYLLHRQSLCGIVLVMDIRHPLTDFDRQMITWSDYNQKPLHILLTKADKMKFGAAKNTMLRVQKELNQFRIPVTVQLFSALKKTGIDQIHEVLDRWLRLNHPHHV